MEQNTVNEVNEQLEREVRQALAGCEGLPFAVPMYTTDKNGGAIWTARALLRFEDYCMIETRYERLASAIGVMRERWAIECLDRYGKRPSGTDPF